MRDVNDGAAQFKDQPVVYKHGEQSGRSQQTESRRQAGIIWLRKQTDYERDDQRSG